MASKNLRIAVACILAYTASAFLMQAVSYNGIPAIEAGKVQQEIANSAQKAGQFLGAFGASLVRLASIKPATQTNTAASTTVNETVAGNSSFGFSTLPTSTPAPAVPTTVAALKTVSPTTGPTPIVQPTAKPTAKPQPTAPPAPTEVPTPALPAGYARPGKSLEDIFDIASQKACIPKNLLKAFMAQESPGVLTYSDQWALFYNGYDWWHRVTEKKRVCGGYAYITETGLIPSDSLFAGEQCKEGVRPGDNVSNSMGAGQMLEYYWNKTFKDKAAKALGISNPDRRVLLDALVGFGININEGTKAPGGCDNWDFKYIIKAACVNTGGGSAYSYYYGIICRNYNKYANQNNNCDNVASMIVPDSYCQLK